MIPVRPTLNETRSLLLPGRAKAFAQAQRDSIKQVNSIAPPVALAFDGPTRAMMINRLWISNVRTLLAKDTGVVPGEDQGQQYFVVDEALIIRHKLVDRNLRSSNYPTPHSNSWNLQASLDGMPPIGRLTFGYRTDATGMVLEEAFITFPYGRFNLWVWQVWRQHIDTFGITLPLEQRSIHSEEVYAYDDLSQVV